MKAPPTVSGTNSALGGDYKMVYMRGRGGAGLGESKRTVTFLRYGSVMALGDSPCTLLVSLWLGEVVGASLAMGHALVQSLLAPGAIVSLSVIRCSVGAPSECRVSSASLTCGTDFSRTRNRFYSPFGFLQRAQSRRCKNPNGESNRFRVLQKSVPQVVTTEKCYVYTDY